MLYPMECVVVCRYSQQKDTCNHIQRSEKRIEINNTVLEIMMVVMCMYMHKKSVLLINKNENTDKIRHYYNYSDL